MNKKLNKLVTNYPVELNEEEIENLSATLAPVIAACGGGGGTGGKIYTGTGFVNVNNTTNQIGLTEDANDKLNKEYVEYNEYSTAIANRYTKTQTNALLDEKQDTLEFEYDENNKVSAINGSALAGQGGGDVNYSAGIDLKIENNIISVDTNGNPNNTASNTRNFVEGSWTVASGYNSHAEGMATTAYGYAVHAQGMWTKFSSSKWSDTEHPTPIDIYWAAGAGATVEGYCNATTSCPMSGTEGQSDYGPIHGGILKVIGNGNVVHDQSVDPDAHIHTLQPSDALIIFKDGCISAAGNISANGIELGAGGTTYQGRKGVNVDGGYVELTTTAYESVTSIPSISNDVETLKTASGDWNKVSDKLDTTAFSDVSSTFLTAHQSLDEYATKEYANNASANALSEAETWVENQHYLSAVPDEYALKTDIPTTVAQLTDSGNYYTKNQTSGATELSTEFAKYVTSSDITTQDTNYVMTTTGWKVLTLPGGGMTQVIHDETLTGQGNDDNSKLGVAWSALSGNTINSAKSATVATEYYDATQTNTFNIAETINTLDDDIEYISGQVDNKVNKPTEGNKIFVYQTTGTTTSGWEEIPIEWDLTGRNFAIGVENEFVSNGGGTTDILLQGYQNSGTYVDFAQGYQNSAFQYGISQGYQNIANYESMAQGYINTAINIAFAQGSTNSANYQAFAQGILNKAKYDSIAQGHNNSAVDQSIAQGLSNTAYHYSFAQGYNNVADMQSFSQGADNRASYYSQTIGHNLIASGFDEDNYYYGLFAIGGYNSTTSNALFVVGNGSSYNGTVTRSDAFVIYKDGSISAKGDISANGVKLGPGGGGTSYQGRNGVNVVDEYIELTQTAYNAITSVSSKVDIPNTSFVNNYLALRTDNAGNVSGWVDLKDNFYSKSEATGTFVATANIDTTTLSGDGKTGSTKLGVKTDVIATKDYVNSSFLPTSGGTVSGQLVVSGGSNFDQENLKLIRTGLNGYGRIGLASNGALAVKVDDNNSNTTQINIAANASNNELIQVQHGGTTSYLIPAVTSTTTAGLTNDGILHIILES